MKLSLCEGHRGRAKNVTLQLNPRAGRFAGSMVENRDPRNKKKSYVV
jgi:hypothetical protein